MTLGIRPYAQGHTTLQSIARAYIDRMGAPGQVVRGAVDARQRAASTIQAAVRGQQVRGNTLDPIDDDLNPTARVPNDASVTG
eukprot:COSAG02_NODE_441_length_22281_cov_6.119556_16_plen_83_part_00